MSKNTFDLFYFFVWWIRLLALTPGRLAAVAARSATSLPASLLLVETPARVRTRCVALCDFLCREFQSAVVALSAAAARDLGFRFSHDVGPYCLETNRARVFPATGTVCVLFDLVAVAGSRLLRGKRDSSDGSTEGEAMVETVTMLMKQALLGRDHPGGGLDAEAARAHVECIEDQRHLRDLVASSDGIAFVADGSVLPRRGGASDAPMEMDLGAVPFVSPVSLRRDFELPNRGRISGMLVPRGVSLIIGGGYHGKSTLLRALAVGVYDKVPGDGREFSVTDPGAVTVRAEDGRPVSGVDISPFISSLPNTAVAPAMTSIDDRCGGDKAKQNPNRAKGASEKRVETTPPREGDVGAREGVDTVHGDHQQRKEASNVMGNGCGRRASSTEWFSTEAASGSTSQAANVVEAVEAGATALLLDEDTCAGNFMTRDSRMRAIVHHEPIIPFIYRVRSLWLQLGISSVIVVGGCGDYFDVHDTALLVDNYLVSDATERAHSVSRRFCVGRVQFAGRGLVHRLPWPENPLPRAIIPESVLPSRDARSATQRKKQRGDNAVPRMEGCGINGSGDVNGDGDAAAIINRVTGCSHEGRRGDRPEGFAQGYCDCPCFCNRKNSGSSRRTVGSLVAGAGMRAAAVRGTAADVSRVEQLVGRAAQARGCAYGVEWVARAAEESPGLSVSHVLDAFDRAMLEGEGTGLETLLCRRAASEEDVAGSMVLIDNSRSDGVLATEAYCEPLVARPRRFEVAAALHRLPGVRFQCVRDVAVAAAHSSPKLDITIN